MMIYDVYYDVYMIIYKLDLSDWTNVEWIRILDSSKPGLN